MTPALLVSLLIDQTGEMEVRHDLMARKLQHLLNQLQKEEMAQSLQVQVIGMRAATIQVTDLSPDLPFQLSAQGGCDLGSALQLVGATITQQPTARVAVFILLGQEPGGDWLTTVKLLSQYPLTWLALFDFGGVQKVSEQTLDRISRSKGHIHRFSTLSSEAMTQAFQSIGHSIRTLQASPVRPASSVGAPSQAVTHKLLGKTVPPLDQTSETNQSAGAPTPPDAEINPARVTEEGVATGWKEIEPDPNSPFAVAHSAQDLVAGPADWRLIGASRRGKMHAHKGSFREDAFALGVSNAWQFMVVTDGGGSCPLARLGAKVAAAVGLSAMQQTVAQPATPTDSHELCRQALERAIIAAWQALEEKAQTLQVPLGHLGTTFLAVMFHVQQKVVGVAQIGDGLLAAEMADGSTLVLAEPDVGPAASATWFLTSKPWQEWKNRVSVRQLEHSPRLLAAMCDGVADDFIPYDQYLHVLFDHLKQHVVGATEPAATLLALLGYEKRGSFDDRTLTLIYQRDEQTEASTTIVSTADPKAAAVTLSKATQERA